MFIVHSSATHAEVDAMPLASVAAAAMRGATSTILGGNASSMAIFARSGRSAHPGALDRKSSSARSSAGTSRMVFAFIWLPLLVEVRLLLELNASLHRCSVTDVAGCRRQTPPLFHELS